MRARQNELLELIVDARFGFSMSLLFVLPFLPMFLGTECAQTCSEKLVQAGLAPKYTNNVPHGDLKIDYGNSYQVKCGNKLPILATNSSPLVTYDVKEKCKYMTIIFFDPDVPLPTSNLFLHWFVTNIPATVIKEGYEGQAGNERSSYFPPAAPTGNHRYTFCVYCQKRYIKGGRTYNGILSRQGINPKCLARENGLYDPEACNFFNLVLAPLGLRK